MDNPYVASTAQLSSPAAKPARSPLWRYFPIPFLLLYILFNLGPFGWLKELARVGAIPMLPILILVIAVAAMTVGAVLILGRWRFSSVFLLVAIVLVLFSMIYFAQAAYGSLATVVRVMLTPPLTTLFGCVVMLWSSGWPGRKGGV